MNGGSHKVGCLTLPMSSGNTERQLQFMTDLGSTILCCTPSYAANLGEAINERGLRDKIKLKAGIFGAEPYIPPTHQCLPVYKMQLHGDLLYHLSIECAHILIKVLLKAHMDTDRANHLC